MQTIEDFISEREITAEVEKVHRNPNMKEDKWHASASHWRVVLSIQYDELAECEHGPQRVHCSICRFAPKFTVVFSQGRAHTEPPTAEDVLDCVGSDVAGVEDGEGYTVQFDDWADEFWRRDDEEREEHRSTYETILKQRRSLEEFLGRSSMEALMWDTERL